MSAPRLYHFTCDHGHAGIIASGGKLIPQRDVVWLTILAEPDRESTGLTSTILNCDRMAHRWTVEPGSAARSWLFSAERMNMPGQWVKLLESYGDPQHWWISDVPLPAVPS